MKYIHKPTIKEKYSILGFIIYVIIFICLIPYILLRNNYYDILSVYFPNLDNLATAIGYMGGPPVLMPGELLRYLRESCQESLFEFISISIIHYVSLIGLTFIVSYYTYKYKSVSKGWSLAFFLLFITYILPGNIILKLQDLFGEHLNTYIKYGTNLHYIIVVFIGILIVAGLITVEEKLIHKFSGDVASLIRWTSNIFGIAIN